MNLRQLAILSILSLLAICYAPAQQSGGTNGLDQQLLTAAKSGDTATAQSLLQRGASIEAKGEYGYTSLIVAANSGHADTVKLLLDKGANIEAKDNEGETPLIKAAWSGNPETMKLLVDKGANIGAKDNLGDTPLIMAAWFNTGEAVKLLFDKGADIEAKNNNGDTPLIKAADGGRPDNVRLLLDKGAYIEAKGLWGNTPLINAAGSGNTEAVKLLLDKGANIEAKSNNGNTPLMNAAQRGNADTVKLLLDRGAKGIDQALVNAVSSGNSNTVNLLLDGRANIEARDREGDTPLIMAALYGRADTVKVLLDKGANIEAKENNGDTPLISAAQNGGADTVKLLLEKGANIEAKGHWGETPLIRAAERGEVNTVNLLLEKGADANARDTGGRTALQIAISNKTADVAELLAQANPRGTLSQYIDTLKFNPDDLSLRERIIKLAASLQPPPAIPEEARDHFMKAAAVMQLKSPSQADIQTAVKEFRQALLLAPWWGDAYYNLGRALEATGAYDDAIQQLNFYLETKPSDADAQDAQSRIYAIRAEKQSAARAKEDNERELAFKYVSGDAERVRVSDSPANWKPNDLHGIFELYTYTSAEEAPYYLNVFRLPNGRYIAVFLSAQFRGCDDLGCSYAGDKIGLADITNDSCAGMSADFAFDETASQTGALCGYQYSVSASSQPNAIASVSYNNARIVLPVALLYRGRALAAAWARSQFESLQQGAWVRGDGGILILDFATNVLSVAQDPNVDPFSLVPNRVTVFAGPMTKARNQ